MSDLAEPVGIATNTPQWDQDLIFVALSDPVRRELLLALARGGPKPAIELNEGVSRAPDTALKHLANLRAAGLVTMGPNPKDGRRALYALSPSVIVTMTPQGRVVDFGFCTLRLDVF